MMGVITSWDPSRNEFGVPFSEILSAERVSHRRLIEAMESALKKWMAYDACKQDTESAETQKALRGDAIKATQRALL